MKSLSFKIKQLLVLIVNLLLNKLIDLFFPYTTGFLLGVFDRMFILVIILAISYKDAKVLKEKKLNIFEKKG